VKHLIHKPKYLLSLVLVIAVMCSVFTPAIAAENGYYWSDVDSLTYSFGSPISEASENSFIMSVYYWNTTGDMPVNITYSSSGGDLTFYDIDDDYYEYSGKWMHYPNSPGALVWAECALNIHITSPFSATKKISVSGHEIGHALGLAHEDWCLMDSSDYWRYDVMGYYYPQYDDINAINGLY
jgi:hypothetical protein